MAPTLKQQLATFFKGELEDDKTTLTTDEHDASLFEIVPALVACPVNTADLCALVSFVNAHPKLGVSLTARSAGTDMSGGTLTTSVVVDMKQHFNHLKTVGNGFAVTEPGVFYRDFERATLAKGWLLPPYPASRELCTVGGMAANNSGGEKSLRYGKTENFVEKLKVVLRDGKEHVFEPLDRKQLEAKLAMVGFEGDLYRNLYKLLEDHYDEIKAAKPDVSKNSAGYYLWNVWDRKTFDLTKLLVGSQGTLGIITEITYRLVKPEPHSKLLVMFLKDLAPLPQIVNTILAHDPESFESYDDYTLKFAVRYSADIAKFMGAKNVFSLAWQFLPEMLMVLTGGAPKLVMLAEFTGSTEAEVDKKIAAAEADIAKIGVRHRVTKTEQEAQKYWVIRRESFNLLRHHLSDKQTAPFIDDFCVRPEHLPEFLPKLYAILDEYHLILTVVGHVGDGNFHVIPIMKLSDPNTRQTIKELSARVYDLVLSYHGSITGEHNDGLIRSPFLKQMYGETIYGLFEETKHIFDPDNLFNPGKKVGSNLAYALNHLKKN